MLSRMTAALCCLGLLEKPCLGGHVRALCTCSLEPEQTQPAGGKRSGWSRPTARRTITSGTTSQSTLLETTVSLLSAHVVWLVASVARCTCSLALVLTAPHRGCKLRGYSRRTLEQTPASDHQLRCLRRVHAPSSAPFVVRTELRSAPAPRMFLTLRTPSACAAGVKRRFYSR